MAREDGGHEVSTRRKCVKVGGAVLTGGLIAGCTDDSGDDGDDFTPTPDE